MSFLMASEEEVFHPSTVMKLPNFQMRGSKSTMLEWSNCTFKHISSTYIATGQACVPFSQLKRTLEDGGDCPKKCSIIK